MRNKILLHTAGLVLASITLLSYNDNPPNGRTGAPFDGHCNNCHTTNNPNGYNGTAEILGLPDTIQPNTTYPLQLKATPTAGNPIKAGFQLVVVDKNQHNAGHLTATDPDTDTDTEPSSGREYLEHRGAKYFGGMPITWSFDWTSPPAPLPNDIQFYYMVIFCNGGGDFGDRPIAFNTLVKSTVNTNEVEAQASSFHVFPNPASDHFRLGYSAEPPVAVHLIQWDGKLVRSFHAAESSGAMQITDVPAGAYFVKIETHSGNFALLRLVKMK